MKKLHQAVAAAALVLGLAHGAGAADKDNIFGIALPQSMEDMVATAYEDPEAHFTFKKGYSGFFFQDLQRYGDPRLGYSLAYALPNGSNISVYVYNLGRNDIADGVDSQPVLAELASAAQAISASGQYGKVEEHEAQVLSPHFAQAFHTMTRQTGEPIRSYTLLRGQNGFFIKVRITGASAGLEGMSTDFLKVLAGDLGVEGV